MEKGSFVYKYPAWCHLPGAPLTATAGVEPGAAVLSTGHMTAPAVSPRAFGQSACLGARMGGSGGGGDGGGAHGDGGVHASESQASHSPQAPAWEAGPVPLHAPPWQAGHAP